MHMPALFGLEWGVHCHGMHTLSTSPPHDLPQAELEAQVRQAAEASKALEASLEALRADMERMEREHKAELESVSKAGTLVGGGPEHVWALYRVACLGWFRPVWGLLLLHA